MANNLNQPVEISPGVRDTTQGGTPDANTVGGTFGTVPGTDWVSEFFDMQRVEHGAEELSVMVHVVWNGATSIELLPQFSHLREAVPQDPLGQKREAEDLPINVFDGARVNSSFVVEQDEIQLLQVNFRTDPGAQELPVSVVAGSRVRFLAKATGGTPTLRMQVLAGGGWRGA